MLILVVYVKYYSCSVNVVTENEKCTFIYDGFFLVFSHIIKEMLSIRNSRVELTLKNQLTREKCPRTYKHMVKLTLNSCKTLGS